MGTRAATLQWSAPEAKFLDRVNRIYASGASIAMSTYSYNVKAVPVTLYVAQLIPLPDGWQKKERGALFKITHMANNSVDTAAFFHLNTLGGPKIRSLTVSARAAMMRTARNSVPEWPSWKEQIIRSAQDSLPAVLWGRGEFQGRFWDSTPIAFNLSHAFAGFPGEATWASGARRAIGRIAPPPPSRRPPSNQVQKICYQELLDHAFPDNFLNLVSRRVESMCGSSVHEDLVPNFHDSTQVLKTLRKHDAMRVIKTWVNSWHTSDRYHESIRLPCIFGCADAVDKLAHYILCNNLHELIRGFVPDYPTCTFQQLGLINPNQQFFKVMSCTFGGYHASRRLIKNNSDLQLNFTWTPQINQVFCDAFWADALDCGLRCRHLRAPEDFGGAPPPLPPPTDDAPETDVSDTSASGTCLLPPGPPQPAPARRRVLQKGPPRAPPPTD